MTDLHAQPIMLGQVVLALVAIRFEAGSIVALLAGFWLVGTVAGPIWWRTGQEANGRALESLVATEPFVPSPAAAPTRHGG